MHKTVFVFLLMFFIAFSAFAIAAESESRVQVVAEGSGATKMEAMQNAWMEAVRKAVGLFMTAKTNVINDELTEKIVTYSRGQVNSYKVLSENQTNGVWNVTIEASIDKDVLRETTAQGASKTMTFDGSNAAAKEDTTVKKEASQKEILLDTLSNLDLAKILRYNSELKKVDKDGKTIFYVQHTLAIDPEQFKILADQLERTLAPIALSRETVKLNPVWGKAVMDMLKNWNYTAENIQANRIGFNKIQINPSQQNYNLNVNVRRGTDIPFPKDSICIFKNAIKADCYSFPKDSLPKSMDKSSNYSLRFEVEGGDTVSEISPVFGIIWPNFGNTIFIDPAVRVLPDYNTTAVILRFNQPLNLTREEMLEVKEFKGSYMIKKK